MYRRDFHNPQPSNPNPLMHNMQKKPHNHVEFEIIDFI